MALSREEVEKIASLAHLKLSDGELEMMKDSLSSVLEYVNRLKEADTDGIEPTAHITGVENILREDIVADCDKETRDAIIEGFPDREGDQLKVKPVFK